MNKAILICGKCDHRISVILNGFSAIVCQACKEEIHLVPEDVLEVERDKRFQRMTENDFTIMAALALWSCHTDKKLLDEINNELSLRRCEGE